MCANIPKSLFLQPILLESIHLLRYKWKPKQHLCLSNIGINACSLRTGPELLSVAEMGNTEKYHNWNIIKF